MDRQEIYINNSPVDLFDSISIPLNFNVADIRDPSKRNASYSKTISIPATKNNNLLFTNIFEVNKTIYTTDETINFSPDFNPNLKASCLVYINSILQMSGYIQLINITKDNGSMTYDCVIVSDINNIFSDIGDKKLTALDLSKYTHILNKASIINSWDTSIKVNGTTTPFSFGSGYVYSMVDLGFTDGTEYNVSEWYPSIFAKTYVDQIFTEAGYTYTSSFFNSDLFKHLVVPHTRTSITMSQTQIDSYLFKATNVSYTNSGFSNIQCNTEQWDLGSNYNTSTYKYTASKIGTHIFDFKGQFTKLKPEARFITLQVKVNGSTTYDGSFEMIGSSGDLSLGIYGIPLSIGDYVEFFAGVSLTMTGVSAPYYSIDNFSVANRITNTTITEGVEYDLSLATPLSITQKDFLLSIITMFNLFVEVDKNNEKNLLIEKRDDYYLLGTTIDWSDKVDISKPIEVKPLSEISAKEYIFTYKEDKDFWNEEYTKETNEIYGVHSLEIANDFQKEVNTNKIIFSPTPSVGSTNHNRVVPTFVTLNSQGVFVPRDTNIRLLYYKGVLPCTTWKLKSTLNGNTNYTIYPYMGHFDDPNNPSEIDLNFGVTKKVYWNLGQSMNKNLFTFLHEKTITEITNKDSKLVTLYMRLTPRDIYEFNFKNNVFIKESYFIVNKIIDYDFVNNETTKVELLLLTQAPAYVFTSTPSPSYNDPAKDILEGGRNELRSVSATSLYTSVEGGRNELRNIGATSTIILIEGGRI